jgi:hypothetical protein
MTKIIDNLKTEKPLFNIEDPVIILGCIFGNINSLLSYFDTLG